MRLIYANMHDPIYACYKICQMIVIYNMLKLLTKTSFWNARCNKNYVNIQNSCGRKMSNGYWMHHCDFLFAILNSIRVIFGKNGQCARRGMFVY